MKKLEPRNDAFFPPTLATVPAYSYVDYATSLKTGNLIQFRLEGPGKYILLGNRPVMNRSTVLVLWDLSTCTKYERMVTTNWMFENMIVVSVIPD